MANTSDGGRTALTGFLYQAVVGLGMTAWANCSDASGESDELEALLSMARQAGAHHEPFDSDLGIGATDNYALVQLKYSRLVPPREIYPAELLSIADRLQQSVEQAAGHGWKISKVVLASNRPLSPGAANFLAAAKTGASCPALTEGQCKVLRELLVLERLRWSTIQDKLFRAGRELGALDTEIIHGIDILVSRVVRETAELGSAKIVWPDLAEAFTGSREAVRLVPEAVAARTLQRIVGSAVNPSPGVASPGVLRRAVVDEIAEAASRSALVVLCGDGGCGKTVVLWQWAEELATSTGTGGAFTAVLPSGEVPGNWIAAEISGWANLDSGSPRRGEDHARALYRLRGANPIATLPILHLGIDGLDEQIGSAERQDQIRALVRWFWEEDERARAQARPPEANLVLTCRDADALVNTWLPLASGFRRAGALATVRIPGFSGDELPAAARSAGHHRLAERIEKTLRPGPPEDRHWPSSEARLVTVGAYLGTVPAADERIVESLVHPAMWGALLELLRDKPDAGDLVLNGDSGALWKLASVFCERFCNKVINRGESRGMGVPELLNVLHLIAINCGQGSVWHSRSDWDGSAREAGIGDVDARKLRGEACSGGLIMKENQSWTWRWRHSFVGAYLAGPCVT